MKLISEILNCRQFIPFNHPLVIGDSSLFITEDGSYAILLNIDYDIQLLSDVINIMRPDDTIQLYRILVRGKETWYLCISIHIDYKPDLFSLKSIIKSSFSGYTEKIEDQTRSAIKKLSEIPGKAENIMESLPVKILSGLGGTHGCVGSVRNLHRIDESGHFGCVDQLMICYRVIVPSLYQRKKMLYTYAERSVKMHRQKYHCRNEHVDTAEVVISDEVNLLVKYYYTTCNFYVWSSSENRTHMLLKKLRSVAQKRDLIVGVSSVNNKLEFQSLYPGNASYGYDYDAVTEKFADMSIKIIGSL